MRSLSRLFEVLLSHAASRAGPIVGNVFEWGTRSYSCVGVSFCRVIDPSADVAYIFVHKCQKLFDFFRKKFFDEAEDFLYEQLVRI